MGVEKYSPRVGETGPHEYTMHGCPVDANGYDEYGYHIESGRDLNGLTEEHYLRFFIDFGIYPEDIRID